MSTIFDTKYFYLTDKKTSRTELIILKQEKNVVDKSKI
jgi:hypothetical protein